MQHTTAPSPSLVLEQPQPRVPPVRRDASEWRVEVAAGEDVQRLPRWQSAFANRRKDRRYYELVEDTIRQGGEYMYLVIRDGAGEVRAIQPFFINDQDLLAGTGPAAQSLARAVRRVWPGFLRIRALTIGCAAGEGHLDAADEASRLRIAQTLAQALEQAARRTRARLIVFKEFTEEDRPALACLAARGYTRLPSMPMTRLRLDFDSYEDYLERALSRNTRSKLRRKFKISAQKAAIEMKVVHDITPYIDDLYPLYLAVYERSKLRFEKLTPEYLCEIGRRMPGKAVFFLWSAGRKIAAFNLCLINGGTICSEYAGFDYSVAFDWRLYHIVTRDLTAWAIANNYEWYRSTGLNYEPKYHLRHELEPLDLYVKHTSPAVNFILKRLLPYLSPARYDPQLQRFSNYKTLYSS